MAQVGALQASYRRATKKLGVCGDSMLKASQAVQGKVASLDGELQEQFADIASQFDVSNDAVASAVNALIGTLEGFQSFSSDTLQHAVQHAAGEVEGVSGDLLDMALRVDATRSAYANWHAYSAQLDKVIHEIRLGCARYQMGDTDGTARAAVQAMAQALDRHVPGAPPLLEMRTEQFRVEQEPNSARSQGGAAAVS
jgi:hypothetical protein